MDGLCVAGGWGSGWCNGICVAQQVLSGER